MITATLLIFSTLQIFDFVKMIVVINKTRATILTITIIITTMAISYGEKNVIFVAKKIVVLTTI